MQGKLEEEETVKKQLLPPAIKPVMPPPGIYLFPKQNRCGGRKNPLRDGYLVGMKTYLIECSKTRD